MICFRKIKLSTLGALALAGAAVAEVGPVTPNASKEAGTLLHHLYAIRGKGMMTGVHDYGDTEKSKWCNYVKAKTGEYPAVKGLDVALFNGDQGMYDRVYNSSVEWWKAGGVVTLTWHWAEYGGAEEYQGKDAGKALTPGTAENKKFNNDLDNVATRILKRLEAKNVPVLWRPWHEMNGGWFWWGNKGETTKKLWIHMFDRYTKHHGLKNLIWVWSPNFSPAPDGKTFPGHPYVDVLGADVYVEHGSKPWPSPNVYQAIKTLANGKPMCIGEIDRIPDVDRSVKETPEVAWFMIWGNRAERGNTVTGLKAEFTDRLAANLGDVHFTTSRLEAGSGGNAGNSLLPVVSLQPRGKGSRLLLRHGVPAPLRDASGRRVR